MTQVEGPLPRERRMRRVEGQPAAWSKARARRLRKMLRDLMHEYAAASAANPTKAHHLAEAVIDLCVMIQRTENHQHSTRHDEEPPRIAR
jgi:hypothetical protein